VIYKKSSIFGVGCLVPTPNIVTLVSPAYVNWLKKSIFNNTKLLRPDLGLRSPDRSPPLSGCHSTMPSCQSSRGPPARRRHQDDDGCKDGGAVAARLLVAGRPSALSLPIIEASMPPRWRTSLLAPPPCVGELLLLAGALLEPELLHLVERMMEQEREREERRGHGMELLHPCLK
jgi:hypothetical protein